MKNILYISYFSTVFGILFFIYNKVLIPQYLNALPKLPGSITRYQKNVWTSQKCTPDKDYYNYSYKFRDHGNQTLIWKWLSPRKDSDTMINRFGVPPSIYKPYIVSPDVLAKRKLQIEEGYFHSVNNLVIPDYSALVTDSRPLVAGLTDLVQKTAENDGLTHRETVELIMAFCQDIPYGVPPKQYKGKVISGMFPPPLSLNKTWGDCDTKALLFASIYLSIPGASMVLLESPGHISVGIEGIPGPYDNAVSYGGKKFIFAEPVGPGKHPLGHARSPYVQIKNVYPFELQKSLVRPKLPMLSESVSLGNTVILSLKEGNRSLVEKVKLFYNHDGQERTYYELTSRPRKDGSIKYSSEKNKIYLMIKEPGYYHYGGYDLGKKTNLDLDFSKGNCIYIKTQPRKKVFLFHHKEGQYSGLQFQADNHGVVRAIMESGEYMASLSRTLTGDLKRFDREKRTGINFSL